MVSPMQKLSSRLALWANAVRDSFVVLLPITFFGVVAVLLGNFPVPALQDLIFRTFGSGWQALTTWVIDATYGVFGVALAVVLSIQLARRLPLADDEEMPPLAAVGISGLVNFMFCVLASGGPNVDTLGHRSMLLGIAIGIATPEMLRLLARVPAMGCMSLGYETDPEFYRSMRSTPSLVVAGLGTILVAKALVLLPLPGMGWLNSVPATIDARIDADWVLTNGAVLVNQVLWFFGVHGGKVLDHQAAAIFGPVGASYDPSLAWRPLIDVFVHLGGSGATLGLMVALFIVAREGPYRRIAQMSVLPSIFNINEILTFGLPIALNPVFLVPFLLAPLTLACMALIAVHTDLVILHTRSIPWTTPPLLSGYLLTDSWRGMALQALGLVVSTRIYLPFVRRAEAKRFEAQAAAFARATAAIVAEGQQRLASVRRNDEVGLVARGLLADLTRDIGSTALKLAFQPKHDRTGAAVGVEALLRWTHRRHGAVRPDVAVTLAEEGGLIRRLGIWVLEQACERKAEWNRLGLSRITMAINVSPLQLDDPLFPATVSRCIAQHGLAPGEIELEITESHGIPISPVVDDNLAQIAAMGVSLAMDDFGMGHSSLVHLRRFHVHSIKIDGSLTRVVLTNPTCGNIIRSITALARAQQAKVVAEFVETAAQRDILLELGCDIFQGYLYSPPLFCPACIEYLITHAPRSQSGTARFEVPALEG
ncbi:MAG: EAL domain-containing protein [Rhodocyclaceae bacterium]